MGAVWTATIAGLRRRRLQSVAIASVLLLATAAATFALSVLEASHAPFDRAFGEANGAHLVLRFAAAVDPASLAATSHAPGITAAAGPWPVASGAIGAPKGGLLAGTGASFSARPTPDRSIDSVTLSGGRWWQAPGEAVLGASTARRLGRTVGDTIDVFPPLIQSTVGPGSAALAAPPAAPLSRPPAHRLTVVGVAQSVSTPDVAAWMSAADLSAVVPNGGSEQEMLYRVSPDATAANLGAATASIARSLPSGAVTGSQTWLDLRTSVNRLADLYVPVLLAFSLFALLAAAFIVANVVGGVVLTRSRDIGVMKAIGFAPRQVTAVLAGQTVVPASIGTVAGVAIGTIASRSVVSDTSASFGVPQSSSPPVEVIVTVLLVALATALAAAAVPAAHAGRLSAIRALAGRASARDEGKGGSLRRLGLRLPVRLPVRLGVSAGVAHPGRAAMTLGAIVVGVAGATFAIGLNASLQRVYSDLHRNVAAPLRAEVMDPAADSEGLTTAIAALPETGRLVSIGQADIRVPGMSPVPFVGYQGDSGWLGYAIIDGRWFAGPGEAVAPTNFFTRSGLRVGDVTTLAGSGGSLNVRLVGEIFDMASEDPNDLVLRGTWSDLLAMVPSATVDRWEARPADGVDPSAYRTEVQDAIGGSADVFLEHDLSTDDSFLLFLSVVGVLGIVLVTVALGGVFNTVLLETRQRTRELAVLKTIGLSPVQAVTMIVATIVPAGLVAGVVGVPVGLLAVRVVLTTMGEVAAKLRIPAQELDVLPPLALVGLALLGLAIGALGALVPAQRAARARIAPVLQAE